MTCVYKSNARNGWRLELYVRGMRRSMWLGPVNKRQAETIRNHVDALKIAAETGTQPDAGTIEWTRKVGPRIQEKLTDWGLIDNSAAKRSFTLREWCDYVLAMDQFKEWDPRTRGYMVSVANLLVEKIGPKPIDRINESDAELFAQYLYGRDSKSDSHAGKQVKRARQFFNVAIKQRILDKNPFHSVRASSQIDKTRQAYISTEEADRILAKLPDQLWRTIFVLARYCGLRVPSEIQTLEWSFVDWENARLKIVAPKQRKIKHRHIRHCPLAPNVIKELRDLFELAKPGAVHICHKYRTEGSTAHFRGPLLRAIELAGVTPWPKLYVNLRASARTDFSKIVPAHVANEWLGHDTNVAIEHYERITESDWAKVTAITTTITQDHQTADSQ